MSDKVNLTKRIEELETTVGNLYAQVQTLESGVFLLQTELTEIKEFLEQSDPGFSSGRG